MAKKKEFKSKDKIVKVAFALFLEKGFKEVTIKNIMEATKLSKGAIYHHFESKEEIYFQTLSTYYFGLLETANLGLATGNFRQDVETLYSFVANMFGNVENISKEGIKYPIRNFFSFQLESEKNEIIQNITKKTVVEYRERIAEIVVSAIEHGQLDKNLDVDAVALQIIGMIEGVAINHSTLENNVKKVLMEKFKKVFDSYFQIIRASN